MAGPTSELMRRSARAAFDRSDVAELARSLPRGRYDLFALARKLAHSRRRVSLRLDCGTEDFLIESNRRFHAYLDKLGLRHEYAEHPGAHDWAYWDEHIRQTVEFVMRHVG